MGERRLLVGEKVIFVVLFFFSLALNVVFALLLKRAVLRLLQFDKIFEMFVEDIRVNVDFFEKLAQTPLLSNSPEVAKAHQNMQIIRKRLDEYARRMLEEARKDVPSEKEGV